jgi:hypothetical protein
MAMHRPRGFDLRQSRQLMKIKERSGLRGYFTG